MRRLLRILWFTVLGFGALTAAAVLAAAIAVRTDRFQRFLREEILTVLGQSFRAEVSLERVEGSVWHDVSLVGLAIRYQGRELLRVPELRLSYSLAPLLWKRVEVLSAETSDVVLDIRQDDHGNWDLLEALSPAEPSPPTTEPSAIVIALDEIRLAATRARITPAGEPAKTYELFDVGLDGALEIGSQGLRAKIYRLASRVVAPDLPESWIEAAMTYDGTTREASADIPWLDVATRESRLRVSGSVHNLETLEMDLRATITALSGKDIGRFAPEWPQGENLSGTISLTGSRANLTGRMELAAAGANLIGDLHGNLAEEVPRYEIAAQLKGLDLARMRSDAAGLVDATLHASGAGTSLDRAAGDAELSAGQLSYTDWQIGNLSFRAHLADQKADFSGELTGPGRAGWSGWVDLSGSQRYSVELTTDHLNPRTIAPGRDIADSDLNLRAKIAGKAFQLPEAEAESGLTLLPSRIGSVMLKTGKLDSTVRDGKVQIREASLVGPATRLSAKGDLGLVADREGRLSYALDVDDLSRWMALAGQQGGGRVKLQGEARGNPNRLAARGQLDFTELALGDSHLDQGRVHYDLRDLLTEKPGGNLTAALGKLEAGVALAATEAKIRFGGLEPTEAHLDLSVRDNAERQHSLAADIAYRAGEMTTTLSALSLELPDGAWKLERAARMKAAQGVLAIDRLAIVNGQKRVWLDGRVATTGPQGMTLAIESFPLDGVRPFLPTALDLAGVLGVEARVTGTAAAPEIATRANLADLRINGQSYAGFTANGGYRNARATLDLEFRQDQEHVLTAHGDLPAAITWQGGWKSETTGDLDLRAQSTGLSLVFLNAFGGRQVKNIAGDLVLDLAVRGPVAALRPSGTAALRNGAATIVPLNVSVSEGTIETAIEPAAVRVTRLFARAGDGTLEGTARAEVAGSVIHGIEAKITVNRWPAIYTGRYRALLGGELDADGTFDAPRVRGRLEVFDALLRPDLEFLEKAPPAPDATIRVVGLAVPPPPPAAKESAGSGSTYDRLALDVSTVVHRNSWVKHENATVELEGDVRAAKEPGRPLALSGGIRTVRGWANFQGKRFSISQGQVVFTGGSDLNPALDVTAQYKTRGYLIETLVGGTVSTPSLNLRSDPTLEQADILSVLLFGKPASELNEGQQAKMSDTATAIATTYAADRVAQSVANAVGLERAGIQIEEASSSRVALGKYLTEKTYLRVGQDIGGNGGQEAAIDYEIIPNWELETSTTSAGAHGADVIWHKRY